MCAENLKEPPKSHRQHGLRERRPSWALPHCIYKLQREEVKGERQHEFSGQLTKVQSENNKSLTSIISKRGWFNTSIDRMGSPDLVDDVDTRLLQQCVLDKRARDDHLACAGLDKILSQVRSLHHVRTKAFSCVHHGFQQALQEQRSVHLFSIMLLHHQVQ